MDRREHVRFLEPRSRAELRVLDGYYTDQEFAPHFHYCYSVGVLVEGAFRYRHCRREGVARKGTVLLVNPGEVHSGSGLDGRPFRIRVAYVGVARLVEIAHALGRPDMNTVMLTSPVVDDVDLAARLMHLFDALLDDTDPALLAALEASTLSALVERYGNKEAPIRAWSHERRRVRLAREFLEAHYQAPVRLTELSARAGLSRFHFLRVFQEEVGLTPHRYLTQVRLERARAMLTAGDDIAHTALACGFNDQSHLNRQFKRLLGVTPGAFVRATRGSCPFRWADDAVPGWIARARSRRSG